MRSDEDCLREMLDAADQILDLAAQPDAERLLNEDRVFGIRCSSSLSCWASRFPCYPNPCETKQPEVPWRRIAAFRHRVAHGYFGLSLPVVWQICREQIPELRRQLGTILSEEFGGGSETSQV